MVLKKKVHHGCDIYTEETDENDETIETIETNGMELMEVKFGN